jgi:hypothetical protein
MIKDVCFNDPGALLSRIEARGLPMDVQRTISRVQTADEARKSHFLRFLKKNRPD